MNTCYVVRSSRPAGLFSFGLLGGLHVRLATTFINSPGGNCWSVSQRVGQGSLVSQLSSVVAQKLLEAEKKPV